MRSLRASISLVVQLGDAQSLRTNEGGCGHAEAPVREHHYLFAPSHYERYERISQRQDSMGEIYGSRIPEQTELH
jgi:hypothetical protein